MAKLIEITGKALSGEWGKDDETGNGVPVLRTTNFTNEGIIDYNSVVTRTITKKNIGEKFLRKGTALTMLPHWLEQMSVLLSAPEPT